MNYLCLALFELAMERMTGFSRRLKINQGLHIERAGETIDITVMRILGSGAEREIWLGIQNEKSKRQICLTQDRPEAEIYGIKIKGLYPRKNSGGAYLSFYIRRHDLYSWYKS